MTQKEQDKLWAELSEESKEQMRERYNKPIENSDPNAEYFRGLRYQTGLIFGKHNLRPALTYEDVARELFEDGYYYYENAWEGIGEGDANLTMPMACISYRQVEKLCAINKLLNVCAWADMKEGISIEISAELIEKIDGILSDREIELILSNDY